MLIKSLPSPISEEEEQEIASLLIKRKRSSPISRAKSSSTPQVSSTPTTVATLPSAVLKSGPAPSPDEDDHLTIKKLKVQHSQGSDLHTQLPSLLYSLSNQSNQPFLFLLQPQYGTRRL